MNNCGSTWRYLDYKLPSSFHVYKTCGKTGMNNEISIKVLFLIWWIWQYDVGGIGIVFPKGYGL